MARTAVAIFALFALVSPAAAQSSAGASSTLEMRQSLTIGTARTMTPSGEDAVLRATTEEGVYQVVGDPDRVYRVRATSPEIDAGGPAPVIQSQNSGDISDGGLARLDSAGRDTIRIGNAGVTKTGSGAAPVPVSLNIDYE